MKGLIFDIKRYSINDGPGIRTTVFFKGCPLNCLWCHNPESRLHEIEFITRQRNLGNTAFEEEEAIGRWFTVAEVLKELEKDNLFYDESGGGITFSGGEPLVQAGFVATLAAECRKRGWHTTLDTCGYAKRKLLQQVEPYIDLYLYDLKGMNNTDHILHTGVDNQLILDNLLYLLEQNRKVIFRYPVIPGMNDSENNLLDLMHFLMNIKTNHREIHLLPYHNIQKSKYERLGLKYQLRNLETPHSETLDMMKSGLESIGYIVKTGG
jgi:pyruvate formate lyase activating enzyme